MLSHLYFPVSSRISIYYYVLHYYLTTTNYNDDHVTQTTSFGAGTFLQHPRKRMKQKHWFLKRKNL